MTRSPSPKGNWSYLELRLQETGGTGEGLLGSSLCLGAGGTGGFICPHLEQSDASSGERSLQVRAPLWLSPPTSGQVWAPLPLHLPAQASLPAPGMGQTSPGRLLPTRPHLLFL